MSGNDGISFGVLEGRVGKFRDVESEARLVIRFVWPMAEKAVVGQDGADVSVVADGSNR